MKTRTRDKVTSYMKSMTEA